MEFITPGTAAIAIICVIAFAFVLWLAINEVDDQGEDATL